MRLICNQLILSRIVWVFKYLRNNSLEKHYDIRFKVIPFNRVLQPADLLVGKEFDGWSDTI